MSTLTENFVPEAILKEFDDVLGEKGLRFEGVVIGGAAISLLYNNSRVTQDIDSITLIPSKVRDAAGEFADKKGLKTNWLNSAVTGLDHCQPHGWGVDTRKLYEGKNLTLSTLSRINLLFTKVFSFCDRKEGIAIDLPDIKVMAPSIEEIEIVIEMVEKQLTFYSASNKEKDEFREMLGVLTEEFS